MTDLNLITRYLGVQFHCTSHALLLQQTAYAHSILALTNMEDSRPTLVPYQDGIICVTTWVLCRSTPHYTDN
jgi:hypothetical protein